MKNPVFFIYKRFALNAYVSENYSKALKYFNRIKKGNPNEPGINYNIGLCEMAAGNYEEAETCMLEDLWTFRRSYDRLRTLAELYFLWGRREKALEIYKEFREETGGLNEGEWLDMRIAVLESEEKFESAHAAVDKLKKAVELMKSGGMAEAAGLLAEAAKMDPGSYQIRNNLGVIAMKHEDNPAKALEYFRLADRLKPLPVYKANIQRAKKEIEKRG